jgi:hypothetical protein|tara:strand:+ start:210 stop:413 length:204 start_codon:yes stop_codon:yes gene_type:complete
MQTPKEIKEEFIRLADLLERTGLIDAVRGEIKDEMLAAKEPNEWLELKVAAAWLDKIEGMIAEEIRE